MGSPSQRGRVMVNSFAHAGVLVVAEARDRVEAVEVDPAGDQHLVGDVEAGDPADHHAGGLLGRRQFERDDLRQGAFEVDGALRHPRWLDRHGRGFGRAGMGELDETVRGADRAALTASRKAQVARLGTNSPVAWMLATKS